MTKEDITKEFNEKGVNISKLLFWLQQPKQGIVPQLALLVIKEVAQELNEGKQWYLESLVYPEEWRKQMEKGVFADSFWLENYVLERCKWVQEDLIESGNLSVDPIKIENKLDMVLEKLGTLEKFCLKDKLNELPKKTGTNNIENQLGVLSKDLDKTINSLSLIKCIVSEINQRRTLLGLLGDVFGRIFDWCRWS